MAEIDIQTGSAIQNLQGLSNTLGSVSDQFNGIGKDSQAAFGTVGANANILSGDMNNLSLTVTALHSQFRDYLPAGINTAIDGMQGFSNTITNMFNGSGGNPLDWIEGSLSNIGNLFASGGIFQQGGLNAAASMLPFTNMLDKLSCELEHLPESAPESIPCPQLDCPELNLDVKTNAKQATEEAERELNQIPKEIPVNIPISLAPGIPMLMGAFSELQTLIRTPLEVPISLAGQAAVTTGVEEIQTLVRLPNPFSISVEPNSFATVGGQVSAIQAMAQTPNPITVSATESFNTVTTTLQAQKSLAQSPNPITLTETESFGNVLGELTVQKLIAQAPNPITLQETASFGSVLGDIIALKTIASMPVPFTLQTDATSYTNVLADTTHLKTAISGNPAQIQVQANVAALGTLMQTFLQTKQFIESQPIQVNVGGQGGDNSAYFNALGANANNIMQGAVANAGQQWTSGGSIQPNQGYTSGSSSWVPAGANGYGAAYANGGGLGQISANPLSLAGNAAAGFAFGGPWGAAIGAGLNIIMNEGKYVSSLGTGQWDTDAGQGALDTGLAFGGGAAGSFLGPLLSRIFGNSGAIAGDVIPAGGSALAQTGTQSSVEVIEGELINLLRSSGSNSLGSGTGGIAGALPAGTALANGINVNISVQTISDAQQLAQQLIQSIGSGVGSYP